MSDEQVKAAMRFAFETLKLVIEPGGAVALAAILHGLAPTTSLATAVVVSGANVDPTLYAAILSESLTSAG